MGAPPRSRAGATLGGLAVAAMVSAAIGGAACDRGAAGADPTASADTPGPSASAASSSGGASTSAAAPAGVGDAARGRAIVEKSECNRCHEGTGLAEPPLAKQCFGCHVDIVDGTFRGPRGGAPASWKPRVAPLLHTPSLAGALALHRPEWVASFLHEPSDLRPALVASMPRLRLDAQAVADVVAFLEHESPAVAARAAPIPSDPASVERGRSLFTAKGCAGCHGYEGAGFAAPAQPGERRREVALAPDLRGARERVRPERLVAWLLDPKSVRADAAMPKVALSEAEAADLAAFVLHAPLEGAKAVAPVDLTPLDRPVTYDEVELVVLRRTCWHCHAPPDDARGDGGPGNTGGFGFAGRGVDLSSYEAVSSGYLDANGERRSLFAAGPTGLPMLVEVLVARRNEEAGKPGELRGMPLGLPSETDEHIRLVATWIKQGRPR